MQRNRSRVRLPCAIPVTEAFRDAITVQLKIGLSPICPATVLTLY